jgi:hypothetical protein
MSFNVRGRGIPAVRLVAVSLAALVLCVRAAAEEAPDPLLDWTPWETYRDTVRHPCVLWKPADLARARANAERHDWARTRIASQEGSARALLERVRPEQLLRMIPRETPGDRLFTPCPSCRALGKPVHPHGLWAWTPDDPDRIVCKACGVAFPNDDHPETVELHTRWRRPSTLLFYGGDPFVIFGYRNGRPSFSGCVRAHKVNWTAAAAQSLAEAHLLTGKPEYAQAVRAILLRFAECFPDWLVHTGYGEYADMDPRRAAAALPSVPEPELCVPPNLPDRQLYTGYWQAGRATGTGMEGGFVSQMTLAYDWTCGAKDEAGRPVYSDEERRRIERDLLLESTILLVCDKAINNKSVGNRTAAALVGICVGHPGLVRFGLEGFRRTVDGWFQPDGTASESVAYGIMTLGGIWEMPLALRGYRDPPGYRDAGGARLDSLDLYRARPVARMWDAFFLSLQGDLRYPALADTGPDFRLDAYWVELMAAAYPNRPQYRSLLAELLGPGRGTTQWALYVRDPGFWDAVLPALSFPDWCPPDLRIGHLRSGPDGRESLVTLSASPWAGGHRHADSLNLTYWKNGHDLLSDLGYLWDHPLKTNTLRTLAHNTVLVDSEDQQEKDRGGEVVFFQSSPRAKVMEARSQAYPRATEYRRTTALVDHGGGRGYVVDFFRVAGAIRHDFVYHASVAAGGTEGAEFTPDASVPLYDLTDVRSADGSGVWRATWACGSNQVCTAWNAGQPGERAYAARGWGQRDWRNSDIGAMLPYFVRRLEGGKPSVFVSVFEGHPPGAGFVRGVERLPREGAVRIDTADGPDYIFSCPEGGRFEAPGADGPIPMEGRFVIVSVREGKVSWSLIVPATKAGKRGGKSG